MFHVSWRVVGVMAFLFVGWGGLSGCVTTEPGPDPVVEPQCTTVDDCEAGFECVEEICTEIPEPQVTLGFLEVEGNGATYRVVEEGGEIRLIPGFQGVSHIFVTLEFRRVPFTATAGVTWTVTRISDNSLLSRTEIPLPVSFISTPDPEVFQVTDIFVLFPGPASVLGGSEVELAFTLTEADGGELVSITQNAVLTVME